MPTFKAEDMIAMIKEADNLVSDSEDMKFKDHNDEKGWDTFSAQFGGFASKVLGDVDSDTAEVVMEQADKVSSTIIALLVEDGEDLSIDRMIQIAYTTGFYNGIRVSEIAQARVMGESIKRKN